MGFKTRLGGHKINKTFQKFFFSYLCVASVSLSRSFFYFVTYHTSEWCFLCTRIGQFKVINKHLTEVALGW